MAGSWIVFFLVSPLPAIADEPATPYQADPSPLSPQALDITLQEPAPSLYFPTAKPVFPNVEQTVRLVIRLAERQLFVYRGSTLEMSFPIAVGRAGWETPTGQFQVFHMLENPGWTNPFTDAVVAPGPENPLGERWIAFWTDGTNQIGFHGTPDRDSIGQAASHGCIRLYNEDVRALYQLVNIGTPVIVEP